MEVLLTLRKKKWDSTGNKNCTAIQRNWSSCVQKHQCFESWDLEAQARQKYHTLQWRFDEHRILVPNKSFCKSAQFLRSSGGLVSSIRLDRGGNGTRQFLCGQRDVGKFTTEEAQLLVSLPTQALGHRMRENVLSSEALASRIQLTQLCLKSSLPTSCDSREAVKNSTWRGRRMGNNNSSMSRIHFFSIFLNPSLGNYSPKAPSLDQFWKFKL